MGRLKWIGAIAVVLIALAGTAYVFRLDILMMIARTQRPPIGPYHPVTWAQGPASPSLPPDRRPPNIVFILADDLGANDITFNGGGVAGGAVPTPNIDAIGRQGVAFANGYDGNATCAPSRAAIMTGRYPTRFGFEFTPAPVNFSRLLATMPVQGSSHPTQFLSDNARHMPGRDALAVPASEITIAELLRGRGYHTVHLGKWHLGGVAGTRPEQQGFDESLGFIDGSSMYRMPGDPSVVDAHQTFDPIDTFMWPNLRDGVQFNGSPQFHPNTYMTDYLTDNAISAIQANRNRPFFIYLAYNAPHIPLQAPRADYDALSGIHDHRLRVYAAMIRNLDRNIGRVMQALHDQGVDDNTLVIFTSDNGGAWYLGLPDINRPYRGWKATFFEGGIHSPFFMRWPGHIAPGTTFPRPVGHIDIFSTAAAAAGAGTPRDRPIDGVNLLPFIQGQAHGDPHHALFWRSGAYRAVLSEGWKLQVLDDPHRVWLFNLAVDPTERRNLAASEPAQVARLQALLAQQDRQSVRPLWPTVLRGPIPIDHPWPVQDRPGDEYINWDN